MSPDFPVLSAVITDRVFGCDRVAGWGGAYTHTPPPSWAVVLWAVAKVGWIPRALQVPLCDTEAAETRGIPLTKKVGEEER